jgi:O-antigen ligase
MILAGFGAFTSSITGGLYIIGIILAFPRIRHAVKVKDFILYFVFVAFYLISPLFYPRSADYVNKNIVDFVLLLVPYYFLGLMLCYQRDRILLRNVIRVAFLIAVYWEICLYLGLVDFETADGTMGEQMDFAYSLLVIDCFMLVEYNKSKHRFELIGFLLGSIMLLFMGTRGPVVLLALFVALYLVFIINYNSQNVLKKAGVVFLFFVFYSFSKPILLGLSVISMRLGFSSKIFESIFDDTMVSYEESSGRDSIYESMIAVIKHDPTGLGYGFGGDRLFSASNGYAHNFELEILVEFGAIGGSIIFLALLILFVRSFVKIKGTETADIWLVILFWGIMSLQFSMSWLIHSGFFFMVGYFISILRTKESVLNKYVVG